MKVDVEGFELSVFIGAEKLMRGPSPPIVVFEFCDWAERRAGLSIGSAQRLLLDYGFKLRTLAGYKYGSPPLGAIITEGSETLVAQRESR